MTRRAIRIFLLVVGWAGVGGVGAGCSSPKPSVPPLRVFDDADYTAPSPPRDPNDRKARCGESASTKGFPHARTVGPDGQFAESESGPNAQTLRPRGKLRSAEIQRVVRAGFDGLTACYREGLKVDRKLEGDVTVRFVIEEDGHVSHAGLDFLTLRSCDVADCLLERFEEFSFPAPEGGIVTVSYPLRFTPE